MDASVELYYELILEKQRKKESKVVIDHTSFQTPRRCFSVGPEECFGVEQLQHTIGGYQVY